MAQYDEAAARRRLLILLREFQSEASNQTAGNTTSAPQETPLNTLDDVSDRIDDADALVAFALTQAETGNVQVLLAEVNAALKRLDDGTYGKCAVCGRDIDPHRLEALPYATLCIDDQKAADQKAAQ